MLWLLIGYMFLYIHRPFEIPGWEILADIHLERIYMAATLIAVAVWPGKRWISNRFHWAVAIFAVVAMLCWLASPWMGFGEHTIEELLKMLVFYCVMILVVHDEQGLKRLLWGFLAIMAVYMTHSLAEYVQGRHVFRMGIPRMIGIDITMGDPNSFGATIVYTLPFVVAFWMDPESRRQRWFLIAYSALAIICIGLTGSRSAFMGLVLTALMTILRSRGRWRLAVLGLVAAPMLFALLPASLQNRFETIVNPDVGPTNAQTSAEGRIQGLLVGLQLWGENPVLGVGPGAYRPAAHSDLESHNLVGELVGEMGTIGLVAFLGILAAFWRNLRWIRRAYRDHTEWGKDFMYQIAHAIGISVILLLFEGNFGHNLFRYSWYWYGAFLIIARHCVQQRLEHEWYWGEAAAWSRASQWAPAAA